MRRWLSLISLCSSVLAASCGTASLCDPDSLRAALAAARSGDTVVVGACTVAGSFTVPAGVTLAGGAGSVLASIEGAQPVLATESDAAVRGLGLRVEHGGVGLRASGRSVTVSDVEVTVVRGIGIGLDGAGMHATRVGVHGPITETTALSAGRDPATTGTFGVVGRALGDADVTLEDVTVSGFAVAGVSLADGVLTWTGRPSGADVEGTRGLGVALFGTAATFTSVEVTGMRGGPGMPGVGVAVAPSSTRAGAFDLGDLAVDAGEGYGLFGDGADITLAGASFSHMGLVGVRLQGGTLSATDLRCEADGGAGLLAVNVESLTIEGGDLLDTALLSIVTPAGGIPSGEGIQVVRDTDGTAPALDVRLVNVRLIDNGRAGLLLDAESGPVGRVELTSVTASATGTGLGAVAQNTTLPSGWDSGVTRTGAALANDPSFPGALAVQGIMMPPGLVAVAPSF